MTEPTYITPDQARLFIGMLRKVLEGIRIHCEQQLASLDELANIAGVEDD